MIAVIFAARNLPVFNWQLLVQRGARVVEGARLESVYMGNCIEGSNPFLSANQNEAPIGRFFIGRRRCGLAHEALEDNKKQRSGFIWVEAPPVADQRS